MPPNFLKSEIAPIFFYLHTSKRLKGKVEFCYNSTSNAIGVAIGVVFIS